MLLPTNSQLYLEMQSHHFCQDSHTETWLCFVSGHTVFDKIRRSHHINIFTPEEREIRKSKTQAARRSGREDMREMFLAGSKSRDIKYPLPLCSHLWRPARHWLIWRWMPTSLNTFISMWIVMSGGGVGKRQCPRSKSVRENRYSLETLWNQIHFWRVWGEGVTNTKSGCDAESPTAEEKLDNYVQVNIHEVNVLEVQISHCKASLLCRSLSHRPQMPSICTVSFQLS